MSKVKEEDGVFTFIGVLVEEDMAQVLALVGTGEFSDTARRERESKYEHKLNYNTYVRICLYPCKVQGKSKGKQHSYIKDDSFSPREGFITRTRVPLYVYHHV